MSSTIETHYTIGDKTIHNRILSKFGEFLKSYPKFLDLELVDSNVGRFKCHKIFLSHSSTYFHDLLKKSDSDTINIDFNPGGQLFTVIEALYYGGISLDYNDPLSITDTLLICNYYGIKNLLSYIQEVFNQAISKDTALVMCKRCLQYNGYDYALICVPTIAENFEIYLKANILFDYINGPILAAILKHPTIKLTDDEKFSIIDGYNALYPITDDQEKASLSNIFNWNNPQRILWLVNHKCDWLPLKISRPLYREILQLRRKGIDVYNTEIQSKSIDLSNNQPNLSRWYIFYWLTKIAKCEFVTSEKAPAKKNYVKDVDIIQFMRTLGGLIEFLDIFNYGFFEIRGINTLFPEEIFGPQRAFDTNPDSYFMALCPEKGEAGFKLKSSLGTNINLSYLSVSPRPENEFLRKRFFLSILSEVKSNSKEESPRQFTAQEELLISPVPKELFLTVYPKGSKKSTKYRLPIFTEETYEINTKKIKIKNDANADELPTDSFDIVMSGSTNTVGGYVLKISQISIFGNFLP